MIPKEEFTDLALGQGVPLAYVEKDYVMGWLLWGIYGEPSLAGNLILKGGNCLRKVYFPDTRFSDDLDFTAYRLDNPDIFRGRLDGICSRVGEAAGIPFDQSRIRVDPVDTPFGEAKALDARVYFSGMAGDASVTMRVKFDVSEYEKIVLPIQNHPILHPYSDQVACRVQVRCYSLEEVLAEKLRSWIQRTRSRDLFDVVRITQSGAVPITKRTVVSAFLQKTIFKNVPFANRDELLYDQKFQDVETNWIKTIICPKAAFVTAANAIRLFKDFVTALFEPGLLQELGAVVKGAPAYGYKFRSGYRESIINAGRERKILRLVYDGRERDVEPYSFRFKVGKDGYGAEYFYGYDRTRGQTIKSFLLGRVQGVSILPTAFVPRWPVEF